MTTRSPKKFEGTQARGPASVRFARASKHADLDFDLTQTLAHHDAQITSLGSRMGGVESKLSKVSEDVNAGFAQIADRLSGFESKSGPGLGAILGFIATGGAIIGMSAAAITVLVTSFVSPPITRLEGQSSRLTHYVERREEVDRQDYIELRRQRDKAVADDIRSIGKALRELEARTALLRPSTH